MYLAVFCITSVQSGAESSLSLQSGGQENWAGPACVSDVDGAVEDDLILLAGPDYIRWYTVGQMTWQMTWACIIIAFEVWPPPAERMAPTLTIVYLSLQFAGFVGVFEFVKVSYTRQPFECNIISEVLWYVRLCSFSGPKISAFSGHLCLYLLQPVTSP